MSAAANTGTTDVSDPTDAGYAAHATPRGGERECSGGGCYTPRRRAPPQALALTGGWIERFVPGEVCDTDLWDGGGCFFLIREGFLGFDCDLGSLSWFWFYAMNCLMNRLNYNWLLSKSVWQCIFTVSKCYKYASCNCEYSLLVKVRIIHFL